MYLHKVQSLFFKVQGLQLALLDQTHDQKQTLLSLWIDSN